MRFLSYLAVAIAATTLVTTHAASAAEPGSVVVHLEKKEDKANKAKEKKSEAKEKKSEQGKSKNNGAGGQVDTARNNGNADTRGDSGKAKVGAASGPSPRSRNENTKVTYCHVPPGNPANGHLITTSVNAIVPGHTNHSGDIIPPFSYVKHGEAVTFAGQNWDADGRALLDAGCSADAPAGDRRITFCHVPPGNPDNAHVISTSVHAVSPGHTNHAGDVIPPFTYVKDGETMQFAGQNWDAAAAALLDSGCRRAAVSGIAASVSGIAASVSGIAASGSGIAASGTTAARAAVESSTASGVEGAFAERSASRTDEGVLDAILPDTGGARLGLLVLGVGLVAAGGWLVSRRRRTA